MPVNEPIDTTWPVEVSLNSAAPPEPDSIVICAENGGPTVTPATESIKYSMSRFTFS